MRVSVHLSDGGYLDFDDFDPETALDLRATLEDGTERFLAFDMDGATVLVQASHIVRVDLETGG